MGWRCFWLQVVQDYVKITESTLTLPKSTHFNGATCITCNLSKGSKTQSKLRDTHSSYVGLLSISLTSKLYASEFQCWGLDYFYFIFKEPPCCCVFFSSDFFPLYENNNNNNNSVLNSLFFKEKLARIYVYQQFLPQLLTIYKKEFKIFIFMF